MAIAGRPTGSRSAKGTPARLEIRLTEELKDEITTAAGSMSIGRFVRKVLADYLKQPSLFNEDNNTLRIATPGRSPKTPTTPRDPQRL